jgi:hypothetical protein
MSVCVCILVFIIWHSNHILYVPCYTVICGLAGSTIFLNIISYMA